MSHRARFQQALTIESYVEKLNQIVKASVYAQDIRVEISKIKNLMRKVNFENNLMLVKGHEKSIALCQRVPLKYLIKNTIVQGGKVENLCA